MRIWPTQRVRTVSAFTTLTVALATLAVLHDGTEAADLELNDGGVWVTNLHLPGGRAVAAHLNYPSRTLDSYTEPATDRFDVSQEANAVVLHDDRLGGLASVDTATWQTGSTARLPKGAVASQGGEVVAIADPNQGKVWVVPAAAMDSFAPEQPPALESAIGVRAVVGTDETVHTVTPDGTLRDLVRGASGWTVSEVGSTPTDTDTDALTVTAVGGIGVVVDHTAGWVAWPDGSAEVRDAAAMVVQQPGPAADAVVLAGPSSLVRVPLGGGSPEAQQVAANGDPVVPVTVGSCSYAAWSRTGQYVRDCASDADDVAAVYPELTRTDLDGLESDLRFRVNRDVVVLNDAANGDVFLVNEDMLLVNDWSAIQAQIEDEDEEKSDEVVLSTFTRSKENRPPRPEPDQYGVRAGSSVTLPVLANDTDPDGDVLIASVPDGETSLGRVEPVRDGRALRITVPADAEGGDSFTYDASDGRDHGDVPARVQVEVHAPAENEAPRLIPGRTSELTMVGRGTGEHRMLAEYLDPDGDPFWVAGVSYPEGLDGIFRPDGLLKITDDGTQPARKAEVLVTLTDGRDVREVPLAVRVKPRLPLPPVANADFVKATLGEPVVVSPLTNDTDPNGDDLFVTSVDPDTGGQIEGDLADGTFTFVGTKQGAQYVEYSISDGPDQATGVVRVDVAPATTGDARPIPDNDLAVLPEGGETLVDVLSNDTDPLGGVLVLQSVGQDARGVTAEVVDHEFLRVRSTGLGSGTATLTYRVGNRNGSAEGTVTVVQDTTPARGTPLAFDDAATVRSGDIVTVDVLANDVSPGDRELHLLPDLDVPEGADLGTAFVAGDQVRFKADADSGSVRIKYTVADPDENANTGTLDITIQPASGSNVAPAPELLTARLVQGGSTDIEVPLDGLDSDGDSVTLLGLQDAPTLGVAMVESGVITYSSADAAGATGTDTFSYLVEDRYGAQATGVVRVGVAPRPDTDEPPVPTADQVVVRPGRLLAVPVTVNDIDPEGEPLALVDRSVVPADEATGTEVEVVEGRAQLRTPEQPGVLRYSYEVQDPVENAATGSLTVDVRRDAPLQAPVARDDIVPLADVVGQDQVTVDVLRNDEDPDGAASVLTPTTDVAGVTATPEGRLVVPLTPERQVIVYTITDEDEQPGRAVVVVPGTDSDAAKRPVVRSDAPLPLTVRAGEVLEIPVADYVAVRQGRTPTVPFSENVQPGPGADPGQKRKRDDATLLFRSLPTFYGLTSITFPVTDSLGESDPDALTATLTLPIEVESAGLTPPSMTLPTITVTPGEEPRELDLRRFSADPDEGDLERLEYAVDGAAPADVSVDLAGSTLQVSAGADVRPGISRQVRIRVSDGSTDPVVETATIRVVTTTRPLMTVRDAVVEDANADEPETIELADYVTNPFAAEGEPITLVGSPTVTGPRGSATAVASGTDAVVVTPGADFHGTTTVTYVVADATGLEERQVQGLIRLQVRAAPEKPVIRDAVAVRSRTVEVTWRDGENNGAPITGHTLFWRGDGGSGSRELSGQATSEEVSGLTNDREYVFWVVATNEVGDSEPSAESRPARPDDVPGRPTIQQPTFASEALRVTWDKPANDGSPIDHYRVEVNGRVTSTDGPVRRMDLTGLTNGTPYRIRVQAVNDAEVETNGAMGAGPWSSYVAEHPSGEPAAPTNVSITPDGPDADPSALVRWGAAVNNGHRVERYEVRKGSGPAVPCAPESATSCRVSLRVNEDAVFSVRAFNRPGGIRTAMDGWGPWSANTESVRGANPPGAVGDLRAVPNGESGVARVTFTAAALNGAESIQHYYRAGGQSGPITSGDLVRGLPNGTDTTIDVWAVSTANGIESDPGEEQHDKANAYGPCLVDAWNVSNNADNVTFGWRATPQGRSCDVQIDRSHGGTVHDQVGDNGERRLDVGTGRNQSPWIHVYAWPVTGGEDDGRPRDDDEANGTTWGSPTYFVRSAGACSGPGTPNPVPAGCQRVEVSLQDYAPNASILCQAAGVGGYDDWHHTFRTDGSGDAGWSSQHDPGGYLFDSAGARFSKSPNSGEFRCG